MDTIHVPAFPFIDNHFELALWPLALLYWIFPSPVFLLVLQDAAVVACEALVFTWVIDIARRRSGPRTRSSPWSSDGEPPVAWCAASLVALGVLLANPFIYETVSFDFHLEVVGIVFVLASGLCAYRGSWKWAWIWAAVALGFGDVVATYVMAVGITGTIVGGRRRHSAGLRLFNGAGLVLLGFAWMAAVSALGANLGSGFSTNYAYLVHASPTSTITVGSVVNGILTHPSRATTVLQERWTDLLRYPDSTGMLGVLSPIGLPMAAAVLIPSALNSFYGFIRPPASFQNVAAVFFLAVGTMDVLGRLWAVGVRLHSPAARRVSRSLVALAGLAAIAPVAVVATQWLPSISTYWIRVDPPAAGQLSSLLGSTPGDAEVIASEGVDGRFASRTYIYPLVAGHQTFRLHGQPVVFVLAPHQGQEIASASVTDTAEVFVSRFLGGRVLVSGDGVRGYLWDPPTRLRSITFPP